MCMPPWSSSEPPPHPAAHGRGPHLPMEARLPHDTRTLPCPPVGDHLRRPACPSPAQTFRIQDLVPHPSTMACPPPVAFSPGPRLQGPSPSSEAPAVCLSGPTMRPRPPCPPPLQGPPVCLPGPAVHGVECGHGRPHRGQAQPSAGGDAVHHHVPLPAHLWSLCTAVRLLAGRHSRQAGGQQCEGPGGQPSSSALRDRPWPFMGASSLTPPLGGGQQ